MSHGICSQRSSEEPGGIRSALQRVDRGAGDILGTCCRRTPLVQEVGQSSGMEVALGEVVCRWTAQSFLQLSGPARASGTQEQSRAHLGERTGRGSHLYVPAVVEGCAEVRQCAEV